MDILSKIKQADLVGRGGACFPTAKKWSAVAEALADKEAGKRKCYVVCNAAEGEPGVYKDGYILEHYPEKVIDGLKIAIDFLLAKKGYIFLNYSYNKKLNKKLTVLLKNSKIEIFVKPIKAGYIGGEESAILNTIEGRKIEPRLKPPFPTTRGLWNCPTLINNVETFYNVSLVASGEYKNKRFYTITGDCLNEGVYELPDNLNIETVLNQTKNYPKFSFFAQIGGNASGEVLNSSQLKKPVSGAGSIAVYSLAKNNFKKVIKGWLNFFVNESCGQCTPCREGAFRLNEIFMKEKIDWVMFNSLLDNLSDTSLCALGGSAPIAIKSFMKNVYPILNK
ncbi:MAG: NADH-ubiquinone oxidoreductase-F iron-sulfur binding region domain-containing protein [bacterium]|nr:NADH-ubiquinone oxidoreductase-F iron-sulfur binding region domain-containing protein [bacterium]